MLQPLFSRCLVRAACKLQHLPVGHLCLMAVFMVPRPLIELAEHEIGAVERQLARLAA
jgi:hypothetical protein